MYSLISITESAPGQSRAELQVNVKLYVRSCNLADKKANLAGTYRIGYLGDYKPLIGSITPFSGTSSSFTVV
jgi:hypothetical protein